MLELVEFPCGWAQQSRGCSDHTEMCDFHCSGAAPGCYRKHSGAFYKARTAVLLSPGSETQLWQGSLRLTLSPPRQVEARSPEGWVAQN